MARIVLDGYIARYPLGGMASWVLQYLLGFKKLGHDVYFVEKCSMPDECYDPRRKVMSDDCNTGVEFLDALLTRFGLEGRWCVVDFHGREHGIARAAMRDILRSADLFVDLHTEGAWMEEAQDAGARVLIDGEPGFFQMKMVKKMRAGETLPQYDFYYTNGHNVGRPNYRAPTAGKEWRWIFNPIDIDLFRDAPPDGQAFTTIMNWQSHSPFDFDGRVYGQKDVEFEKFMQLPGLCSVPLEVAVTGAGTPADRLTAAGWRVIDAQVVTSSFDSFIDYIVRSAGEFSVCKGGYVDTWSGWFGDRSAAYLAAGRPVVCQDTGFSEHLPCGRGLFAIDTAEAAAAAFEEISSDRARHSEGARELAGDFLDAPKVMGRFLDEIGI